MNDFTRILNSVVDGDETSSEALLKQVYEDLRTLAQARMIQESPNHTLQPTALVHEAWLSLVDDQDRSWKNRAYFFAAAATAMRRILIDHARKKATHKHGGHHQRLSIDQINLNDETPDDLVLLVEGALKKLEIENPKWARIVVMKYYGGMTNPETAEALGISKSTVERCWSGAKALLYKYIIADQEGAS
ncbi:MAG: sigma-70 family RNA polymerase sigma factor [Pontiellaceae bacterium]|nr:sigma-70 family RNA polymerase sigma factor [Pontiellaceae bacterium]MBN2786231.1 sigma-70 family RNA polymerase sigma factor [Pontiellaceae bacterium]